MKAIQDHLRNASLFNIMDSPRPAPKPLLKLIDKRLNDIEHGYRRTWRGIHGMTVKPEVNR